ncbi:acetylornithine deacetylase [Mariniphaga anaerophila]|uniref:Acetylornithine deacetylase n=1 Tax=Mariniphaga anaerophila TaxID=1484053 RepID=A0A1M5FFN7_9BACT|nr:M20 family metallo-hydrolase [Mariniphaga anaerophila]SHF90343.1 acetylornithine deacetylase [Mariniphaga anaerophila]
MDKFIDLLKRLISTPSFSKEEERAAAIMREFLQDADIPYKVKKNNTWAYNKHFVKGKPVLLLNSHIDTVRPAKGYSFDPFSPVEDDDKLYGLGSNDAGGPLVALLAVFMHFYERDDLPFNLIYAATAEEEISGKQGLEIVLPEIVPVAFAIVGEPTSMELAIAEKGLLVLDCYAHGKSGHAARNEGENALYKAIDDIQILRNYQFENASELLGEVKVTVTQIEAGTQHNVVPDVCHFVVDVRTNEHYPNKEAAKIISGLIQSEVKPRSFRLNSSGISVDHPFARKAAEMGIRLYGSPTTSDQAIVPFPSVKMGPGDSARSHSADEYIYKSEIIAGVEQYIKMLEGLKI